jgi:hypothetical protein
MSMAVSFEPQGSSYCSDAKKLWEKACPSHQDDSLIFHADICSYVLCSVCFKGAL